MKKKLSTYLILFCILICLCACIKAESTDTSKENIEKIEEEITSETNEEVSPKGNLITVNLDDVTITPQDNWKLIEFDEANQRVKYEIELAGNFHEITLYTVADVKLDGQSIPNDVQVFERNLADILGWTTYSVATIFSNEPNFEYVFISTLHENSTKQLCCIIGDDRTLILESEPYVVLDEIVDYVTFSCERSDSDIITWFFSAEFCKELSYYEKTHIPNTSTLASSTESSESTNDIANNKVEIVPDTSEYKYWEVGDPMLEFTNKTIVTDNNPDYIIIKNGPGPIVKSSYPYIKTFYGNCATPRAIYEPLATLTIRSTDYYGCPYEFTINGVDYIFEDRMYVTTYPEEDRSEWNCFVKLPNSSEYLTCYIIIVGDHFINMEGEFINASFVSPENLGPNAADYYPKND